MQTISPFELRRMLIGAYLRVASQRESINKINLFPVPDQDTGSNLVKTLKGMYRAIAESHFSNIRSLNHEALEGALTMAAGNAGIITTSFLGGFLETFTSDIIQRSTLVKAFENGYLKAYASVQEPKKGTILDVMEETSSHLKTVQNDQSIEDIIKEAIVVSQKALKATKDQMDLYHASNVVDAGGLGFTYVLEGFYEGLTRSETQIELAEKAALKKYVSLPPNSHRYEVVFLIESLKVKRDEVLHALIPHGDCIDIVEINEKVKVHIHTNKPDLVVDLIPTFGVVLHTKTVDMSIGEDDEYSNPHSTIGLVTDEGSALSLSYLTQHDIALVPFQLLWDDEAKLPEFAHMNIYEKMRFIRNKSNDFSTPKTSQPAPYAFLKAFKDQLQKYQHVICIITSSALSGTYNSALLARNLLSDHHKQRIHIPDLKQASSGQSILMKSSVRLIGSTTDVDTIVGSLTKMSKNIDVFGFGHDGYWITKGGRVSINKAKVLTLIYRFGIHPIFGMKKGKIGVKGFILRNMSIAEMAYNYIMRKYGRRKEEYIVSIQHTDCAEEVSKLKVKLKNTQFTIIDEAMLSPILGVHIGPDAMIIAVTKKNDYHFFDEKCEPRGPNLEHLIDDIKKLSSIFSLKNKFVLNLNF